MSLSEPRRAAVLLAGFAVLFTLISVGTYTRKSATWDEPQHLTSGYMILRAHDYRIDPEHPPFLRIWAALPLMAMPSIKPDKDGLGSDRWGPWLRVGHLFFCHRFFYEENDADRMLYRARCMIVLLGVLLGFLLFSWSRELFGFRTAGAVLALFLLEPNCLAHSQLVTTDLGAACFIFGTVYFAWRTAGRITAGNLAGTGLFFCLAVTSKITAWLLAPLLGALLLARACRRAPWNCRLPARIRREEVLLAATRARLAAAAAILLGSILAAYVAVWALYGFRYAPAPGNPAETSFSIQDSERSELPRLAALIDFSNRSHLLPNALTEGFLRSQLKAQTRPSYLAGHYSGTGWWYYFPVAFLIKTPLAVLVLFFAGALVCAGRRRAPPEDLLTVGLPILVFLGAGMLARINIGLRHILPIYPFVLLCGGWAIRELRGRKGVIALGLVSALALSEFAVASADPLAFFNFSVGGPRNGRRWLVESNLDWGQDLKGLKRWMVRNQVERVNLSYFGVADPGYYGIRCTYLPGSPIWARDRIASPEIPGYVAVSVTNLVGPYLQEDLRSIYQKLQRCPRVAVIGRTIDVYRADAPWW
jgi:hypothetical protein